MRITEPDVPLLCRRLCRFVAYLGPGLVVYDAGRLAHPDLVAIEALARLQLTARRRGARIAVANSSSELRQLLHSTGLSAVLPLCALQRSR